MSRFRFNQRHGLYLDQSFAEEKERETPLKPAANRLSVEIARAPRDWPTIILSIGTLLVLALTAYVALRNLLATNNLVGVEDSQAKIMATETAIAESAERPWIQAHHEILQPLTFTGNGATMTLKETLKNYGHSPALEVFSWEDVVPIGPGNFEPALTRQQFMCDMRRHRRWSPALSGELLFPNEEITHEMVIGPSRQVLEKAIPLDPKEQPPRLGFAVVGCVDYRAAFEQQEAHRHETRFFYLLGRGEEGALQPYVEPKGIPKGLELAKFPVGFSAD